MDTQRLLACGARGTHLLFDRQVIAEAFEQPAEDLRAVVDRELRLLAWSRHAEELWGLRLEEVSGHHLMNLDIGLPVERLRPTLKACLSGDAAIEQVVLDAVNRRGKPIRCMVTCTPLMGSQNDVRGVILLMEEAPTSP